MNLAALKLVSKFIPAHDLFGIMQDDLQNELRNKGFDITIKIFKIVFRADQEKVYFQVNNEPKEYPFKDSKAFAAYVKSEVTKKVTDGTTVDYVVIERNSEMTTLSLFKTTPEKTHEKETITL